MSSSVSQSSVSQSDLSQSSVRNIVLVGHSGAGKTTLVEALLAATGAVERAGTVTEGTTVSDHDPLERSLGRSVSLAAAHTVVPRSDDPSRTVRLTLLDTPGHPDFVGEVRAGLRAADAALFVVSAVDGVDGATRLLWQECAEVSMPRLVVVTHVDQPQGEFSAALQVCQDAFGEGVQPLYLPCGSGPAGPTGIISVLAWTKHDESDGTYTVAPATNDEVEQLMPLRNSLVEGIIGESEDDDLMDRYLAGNRISYGQLVDDLERAVARGSFYPVAATVPSTGLGARQLVELLVRALPAPHEHVPPVVTGPEGEPREAITCDPAGPLVAEVVKTTTDPYVGRSSLVRVFSGTLHPSDQVHVIGHLVTEREDLSHEGDDRAATVGIPQGRNIVPVDQARAGDVVVITRLLHAETGDTLSDPSDPALMLPWELPEPLLPVAIWTTPAQEGKLAEGPRRLRTDDPTVRVEMDDQTGQQILWCQGEAHLKALLFRLADRAGVQAETGPIRVGARQTVTGSGTGQGRLVKQSGGHGQYAVVDVTVEPAPAGTGLEFVDEVTGGTVPRQFIPSVEKGVRAQAAKGVHGLPLVDLRVRLLGGKSHSVDSSDAAFATAGGLALVEACRAGGLQVLEPYTCVSVECDDEFVGPVISDLSTRRARVNGSTPDGEGRTTITADVPELELRRYAVDLRSLAHGTGRFERRFGAYHPAPPHVAADLTAPIE